MAGSNDVLEPFPTNNVARRAWYIIFVLERVLEHESHDVCMSDTGATGEGSLGMREYLLEKRVIITARTCKFITLAS